MINLGNENYKKEVKVGIVIKEDIKDQLLKLLSSYIDIFAWSYQDMPRLDPSIVEQRLPLKPECPPVKQKLRRMKPEVSLKVKEEVKKQLDVGFLEVENIVHVPNSAFMIDATTTDAYKITSIFFIPYHL